MWNKHYFKYNYSIFFRATIRQFKYLRGETNTEPTESYSFPSLRYIATPKRKHRHDRRRVVASFSFLRAPQLLLLLSSSQTVLLHPMSTILRYRYWLNFQLANISSVGETLASFSMIVSPPFESSPGNVIRPVGSSFFAFIRRFWNQILIWRSVKLREWAISILRRRVK